MTQDGSCYDRLGEVFRNPKTGQLVLVEPAAGNKALKPAP